MNTFQNQWNIFLRLASKSLKKKFQQFFKVRDFFRTMIINLWHWKKQILGRDRETSNSAKEGKQRWNWWSIAYERVVEEAFSHRAQVNQGPTNPAFCVIQRSRQRDESNYREQFDPVAARRRLPSGVCRWLNCPPLRSVFHFGTIVNVAIEFSSVGVVTPVRRTRLSTFIC